MYFKSLIDSLGNNKLKIFVDMDGVIADYNVIKLTDYSKKRPLYSNIKKLEEVSKKENVELYILSVSIRTKGIEEKNEWLDRYAPFFDRNKRIIISKEENKSISSKILKVNYIKNIVKDNSKIIIIDDDPYILNEINELCDDVILLKDTVLVD